MYTRPYNEEGNGIIIPESYGGTLLKEKEKSYESSDTEFIKTDAIPTKNPWENEQIQSEEEIHKRDESVETFSLFSKLPFLNIFSGTGKIGNFSLQKIGTEEILIIATAAFLFFTKNGDKECAIMLLLLLFLG